MFIQPKLLIVSLLILGELGIVSNLSLARAKIVRDSYQAHTKIEVGKPPSTEPPSTDSPAGGTLDPSDPCHSDSIQLAVLAPPNNGFSQDNPDLINYPLLTISEHPTFLFYVPYGQEQVRYGEFSIHEWPDEEASPPYTDELIFPQTPGIVSFSVPSNSDFSLIDGKDYRWRLKLYCGPGNTASDYVIVRGVIRKIANTAEHEGLVAAFAPEIWYDSLARLAEQLQSTASSNNSTLGDKWSELMTLVEFGEADSATFTPDLIQGSATVR